VLCINKIEAVHIPIQTLATVLRLMHLAGQSRNGALT
jgi:hypothetical protein